MYVYQRQFVWLLWQSLQDRANTAEISSGTVVVAANVCAASTDGLRWRGVVNCRPMKITAITTAITSTSDAKTWRLSLPNSASARHLIERRDQT